MNNFEKMELVKQNGAGCGRGRGFPTAKNATGIHVIGAVRGFKALKERFCFLNLSYKK